MQSLKTIIPIALSTLWLLLFASGSSTEISQQNDARQIRIEAGDDLKFSIQRIRARPQEKLRIIFENTANKSTSEILHNIAFLNREFEVQELVEATLDTQNDFELPKSLQEICFGKTPFASPENEFTLNFDAPKEKGNYTFFCTVPGHAFLGMQGILIIE